VLAPPKVRETSTVRRSRITWLPLLEQGGYVAEVCVIANAARANEEHRDKPVDDWLTLATRSAITASLASLNVAPDTRNGMGGLACLKIPDT
jgi:hypothetical protein